MRSSSYVRLFCYLLNDTAVVTSKDVDKAYLELKIWPIQTKKSQKKNYKQNLNFFQETELIFLFFKPSDNICTKKH